MSKYSVISEISRAPEVEGHNPSDETLTTSARFQINNAEIYVPFFSLFTNDSIKILENIK